MPAKRPRGKPQEIAGEVLTHQIAVRLTDQEHRELCQLAAGRFITPAKLARQFIRAQLTSERKQIPLPTGHR
jgi:hypothetical protein